jgi:CDP-glucose 4,6-dehydratase
MEDMVIDHKFWCGKRVFVTGHTGFKGGWLCLWLHSLGAEVTGYALLPPTHPSLFESACVADLMKASTTGDVRDLEQLTSAVRAARPEIVIHMAAQALVRYSYANPVETYTTNVLGTVNVLEAVRQVGSVRVVINVTSDKCYENRGWLWGYREDEPVGGYDPYSSSKGCAELISAAYRNSFFNSAEHGCHGVALATVRAGNVIGGGDWGEDRLIPDILRSFLEGRPAVIRSPLAVRPWQHVLEPLGGYLTLAQRLWEGAAFAEAWNFGPNDEDAKPVEWVVKRLTRLWGEDASWRLDGERHHPHEACHLKLDCAKAKARLGWYPRWGLEQALQKIVEWHRAYQDQEDMRVVTSAQIAEYVTLQPLGQRGIAHQEAT